MPLLLGAERCLFHARPFCTHPIEDCPGPLEIVYLDLETTGTDISFDRAVELAAVQALPRGSVNGACFSTTISVDVEILETLRYQEAAKVHGISATEIVTSPAFPECWQRFRIFVEWLLNARINELSDTSDDDGDDGGHENHGSLTRPSEESPTLVLVAHNGFAFDYPLLLFECHRHGLELTSFTEWLFVDTLIIMRAMDDSTGLCHKLQCLAHRARVEEALCAHRARDDCIALQCIVQLIAEKIGLSSEDLLRMFAVRIDLEASLAQVAAMAPSRQF